MEDDDNGRSNTPKRVGITLSKGLYSRISERARRKGQSVSTYVANLVKESVLREEYGELEDELNFEFRIERAVVGRIEPTLKDLKAEMDMIVRVLEERGMKVIGKEDDFERRVKMEGEAPAVEEDEMSLNGSDMTGDFFNDGEHINKEELKTTFNDMYGQVDTYISTKYGGESFGDVEGEDVKSGDMPPGVEEVNETASEPKEYPAPQPPQTAPAEEKPQNRRMRQSRIKMVGGFPVIDGLRIKKQVGNKVFYEDGSIWDGSKWFRKGKVLVRILKEEGEI